MYAVVSLGIHFESCLDSNSKIVSRAANGPEKVWVFFLGYVDNRSVRKDQSARHHVVVEEPILSLQST